MCTMENMWDARLQGPIIVYVRAAGTAGNEPRKCHAGPSEPDLISRRPWEMFNFDSETPAKKGDMLSDSRFLSW